MISNKEKECKYSSLSYCCSAVFCMITLVIVMVSYDNFIANKRECNVVNVTYPTSIPIIKNDSQFENFVDCDCGKRCVSDLGYCIKIFINVTGEKKNIYHNVMAYSSIDDYKYECTFLEQNCPNGESINNRIETLSHAYEIAKPYIDIMNNRTKIYCYTYDDKVYLEIDIIQAIILISITGFIFIITLASSFYFCCC